MKVKICGITNLADAQVAVETGADALGFIFHARSPRNVSPAVVGSITNKFGGEIMKVGVFVNASEDFIHRAIEEGGLNTIQLHGDETPEFCGLFPDVKVVKAFRIQDRSSLARLQNYAGYAWLLDSYVVGAEGGTGEAFNWDLAIEAKQSGNPLILAGGLAPENVAAAVQKVEPCAVDVSSGVEISPGRKDHEKVRAFIANAKRAQQVSP